MEGYLTSLRTALSMLSEDVRNMPLRVFVKKFCPDRECVKDPDSGLLKVMPKPIAEKPDFSGVSAVKRFESITESQKNSVVQPTPRSFPFCTSAGTNSSSSVFVSHFTFLQIKCIILLCIHSR